MSDRIEGEWVLRTNRHPNTDGSLWGWVDERVRTKPGSWAKWTTREVFVWSGQRERHKASDRVVEHNAALRARRRDSVTREEEA